MLCLMLLLTACHGQTGDPAIRPDSGAAPQASRSSLPKSLTAPAPAPLPASPAGQNGLREIGLDRAVTAAVEHYPSVDASVLLLRREGYLVRAAEAAWYPQLDFVWENRLDSDDSLAVTPTLRVSQQVWDFGRTRGEVRQAEARVDRQSAAAMAEVDNIIQQAASALIGLHQQQEQLEAARAWLGKSEEIASLVNYRFGIGLSSEADVKQARTRLEAARSNLVGVQTMLAQYRQRLATLTGLPLEECRAEPPAELELRVNTEDLDCSWNTSLLLAEADQRLAEAQLDSAQAAGLPSVEVVGNVGRTLRGDNPNTGKEEDFYSSMSLNLNYNLFDGGSVSARRRAAESSLGSARRALDAVRMETGESVRLLGLDIDGLKTQFGILANRSRSIRQTRVLYQEQYRLGSRSLLDLLNAEQEYYQAVSEELALRHRLWNDLVSFAVATGRARAVFGLESESLRAAR